MNKISVVIHNGYLSFNKFNKTTKEEDLNNTNVIDTKNIKFTEDYILSNLELVSAFLNLIALSHKYLWDTGAGCAGIYSPRVASTCHAQ